MSESFVRKIARVLYENPRLVQRGVIVKRGDFDSATEKVRELGDEMVRIVLEQSRTPTAAMIDAATNAIGWEDGCLDGAEHKARLVYQAMIDEALR